jgi:Putative peptidoglycan binding domain
MLRDDRNSARDGRAGRLGATIVRHPREFTAILMAGLATATIFVNALFLQHGPHPAPIFAIKPAPLADQSAPQQPRTVEQRFVPEPVRAPAAARPPHNDPIADLIAPTKRMAAVQRALSEFGYGQIKPTGVNGPETRVAIEKFESTHHMPVTGQMSDRLAHELSSMTGRSLD